jgi:hypothetical protein
MLNCGRYFLLGSSNVIELDAIYVKVIGDILYTINALESSRFFLELQDSHHLVDSNT